MRLINTILMALIATFGLYAQNSTTTNKSLVLKTVAGDTIRYRLSEIKEITFENNNTVPTESRVASVENLSPSYIAVEGIKKGDKLIPGETAHVIIKAGKQLMAGFSDYHFMHVHVHVNGMVIVPEVPENFQKGAESIDVAFTVPEAEECNITACYSIQQQFLTSGFTMTLEQHPAVELFGVSPDKKYKYFDAYLKVKDAFKITSVEYKMGDGEWTDVKATKGCDWSEDKDVLNLYHIKIRPNSQNVEGDVALRVKGEQHERHNITWNNATAQYIDTARSSLPNNIIDGDPVVAEIYVNDEYYMRGVSANAGVEPELVGMGYIRFTMPKSDVTVNLDIRHKVPVSFTKGEHVDTVGIYDADDMYYGRPTTLGTPGKPIYFFVPAETGFKPVKVIADDGKSYSFTHYGDNIYMSEVIIGKDASELSVNIQCGKAYTVSSEQVVQFEQGKLYCQGDTVKMAIQVPSGKQIESVKATTTSGVDVPVTLNAPYGTFIMPAEDVKVTVTYSDLSQGDNVSVIAYYDADQYRVSSSTNYDWKFLEGFTTTKGSTIYVTVLDYYGENFYVGVKIGNDLVVYPATMDEDSGEYSFGKAITLTGNTVIKVGATKASVTF